MDAHFPPELPVPTPIGIISRVSSRWFFQLPRSVASPFSVIRNPDLSCPPFRRLRRVHGGQFPRCFFSVLSIRSLEWVFWLLSVCCFLSPLSVWDRNSPRGCGEDRLLL